MTSIVWRILIAIVCFLFAAMALPLVVQILDLSPSASVITLVRLCFAALAVLYILAGPKVPWAPS